MKPGTVLLQYATLGLDGAPHPAEWLLFREPFAQLQATRADDVPRMLEHAQAATDAGAWAAGWLAYEAAPGFDPALRVRSASVRTDAAIVAAPAAGDADPEPDPVAPPLAWFGLYRAPQALADLAAVRAALEPAGVADYAGLADSAGVADYASLADSAGVAASAGYTLEPWRASLGPEAFAEHIARIRELIAAGDTYQVNFTFPLHSRFTGDPWPLFLDLHAAQGGPLGACVLTGRHALCSASPELFFSLERGGLITRPMKGTRARGRWPAEDVAAAAALAGSPKDLAENLMIVDLLRNDLGRVAETGTVEAAPRFELERYPTVWQMTSTVRARTSAGPAQVLAALFPCGSVTGAPKVRTMQIIADLEQSPRGVYTGAIGWLGPGRAAGFNVAIRTVQIDRASGRARYDVGGGITWDSTPEGEYAECLAKARVLTARRPEFELLETLLWEPGAGYFLLDRHLARLEASADYFSFRCDPREVRERLELEAAAHGAAADGPRATAPLRVRLRLGAHGELAIESMALDEPSEPPRPWRVALAAEPVDSSDVFLFHKTTHRAVYDRARAARPDCDDVLLWNEHGELTESCRANLVLEPAPARATITAANAAATAGSGRDRLTPPRAAGLLGGVFREELLARGELAEVPLRREDLARAGRVWLINSVRRWIEVELVD